MTSRRPSRCTVDASRSAGILPAPDVWWARWPRLAPASINQRLAAARAVMRALEWAGLVDRDPFARVSVADTDPREKVQPFSRDEVRALLDVADARLTAIVLLGAHCGVRVAEMVGLEWADLDLAAGTLTVRQGKGRKRRTMPSPRAKRLRGEG